MSETVDKTVRRRDLRSAASGSGPRARELLADRAISGSLSLMFSAIASGALALAFWSLTARTHGASAVGVISAEVSMITFLASAGSLNMINVFARFIPQAGRHVRRLMAIGYGSAVTTGLLLGGVFLLTPWADDVVIGGALGRLAFVVLVLVNTVFVIQDGGLIGFGRAGLVPIENVLVAAARLALLPLAAFAVAGPGGVLVAWGVPMALALLVVNGLIMMRMAPAMATRVDDLPRAPDLARFVAVESVTTAVASSLTAFLPVLVTQRLGSTAGGHFYVPWVITTMVSLLLSSTLIAMVRELVDNPAQSQSTLRRSLGMSGLVVVVAMLGCVVAAPVILWPLGPDFVEHGVPLLRWAGLALPGSAVTLLFWSACLVERRAWPILWMNLAISVGMLAGVLTLDAGDSPSSVGMLYCLVQTAVAVAVARPTVSALRRLRARRHPEMSARVGRPTRSPAQQGRSGADDGSGAAGSTMGLMTPTTGEPSTGGPTTGREPGADPVGHASDGRLVRVGRTAVRVWARPGPSSRPVLLALHGWSDAGLVYRTLARELEDVLDVVAPDAPAHGDTTVSLPPRFTFDDLLPSVLQVYDALDELVGPGRPKVVTGHSMGAMLAASLAARRPEVRHLFLEEPPGPSLMPAPMYRRHELAGLQRLQQLEHADRMLRTGHTEDWSEDDRDAWSITKGQADLTAMAGLAGWGQCLLASLGRVHAPTVLLLGSAGETQTGPRRLRKLRRAAAGPLDVVRLTGAGHNPRREALGQFADVIRAATAPLT